MIELESREILQSLFLVITLMKRENKRYNQKSVKILDN